MSEKLPLRNHHQDDDTYALHATPSAMEAEIVRLGNEVHVKEGRPQHPQVGYNDPLAPPQPPVDMTEGMNVTTTLSQKDNNIISVHGYMHKQGKRTIKGPIPKSWKRRYFALEKAKIYYFHSHLDCRQYFTTRNADLVVGAIELKDALQLCPCARLDLPYKGFEIHTKRRIWVLCPETEEEYQMWFQGVEHAIVANGAGNVIERKLPNIRKYYMKGITTYRFLYFMFLFTGLLEIFGLLFWFILGIEPCDIARREIDCETIVSTSIDDLNCMNQPFNGYWTPPNWYLQIAGVEDVVCFHAAPIPQWISYFSLLFAETLGFFLGSLYYLGMWKPVRRGAHYFDEFEPKVPDELWPKVDVFICHYSEPVEEAIDTLMACMNLQYPPHLLQIYLLDDGYCKTKWSKQNPIPSIELNKNILETAGDLRQEIAQFMYDRIFSSSFSEIQEQEEMEVYAWRKLHSSANLPSPSRPKVVNRSDCAVGSFRDDYRYPGLPHVTFIGRVKPEQHFSKAGNINNVLYNEGANGKYCVILDTDMQPHPKFILATLPFFFDDEDRQEKIKYSCCCLGCTKVAKMCCASCKIAGVPEDRISYCSKTCFDNAMHISSDLHRRQVNGTITKKKEENSQNNKQKQQKKQKKQMTAELHCTFCNSITKIDPQTGICKKCKSTNGTITQEDLQNHHHPLHIYSDNVRDNAVAFVQTPQYFRDCVQLQIGDPLGHRNATFYDAIQTGQDGYDCASFAGTNAMFRREALDSIGGIQYGSLTEDCYTGQQLCGMGWKALYYRKDFEGETMERIRLAEGLIPDSVAASLSQRKRWAKGNFQIVLMNKKKNYIDPEWKKPNAQVPSYRNHKTNRFMRRVFYYNATLYPLGSFSAVLFYYITIYFLYSGFAPIYMAGLRLLIALVPKLIIQGMLSALSNRTVENNDVVRSQETWFAYAFTNCTAVLEAFWWKITGKEPRWFVTGGGSRGSIAELPNVLVFFGTVVGVIWAIVRFLAGYNPRQTSHGASLLFASLLMGLFIAHKLGPSVRMSIQEYFGWSYQSLTDQGNFMGSTIIAFGLIFIALWVYVEQPTSNPF